MVINNYIKRLQTASRRGEESLSNLVKHQVRKEKMVLDVEDILRHFELVAEKAEKAGLDGEFIYEVAYEEAYSL